MQTMGAIEIGGQKIYPGESKQVVVNIARLPSRTIIDTLIHVYRSEKEGPVLLLSAGLHGDEINGIESLRRMIVKKQLMPEIGTVICIPIINIYGFLNFSRDLPDGKDINRSFPGSENGSLASRVAHFIVQDILPQIDYGIDYHTGGAAKSNYPQVRCITKDEENLNLAKAFAAPIILNSNYRPGSLRKEAAKNGKRIIVYEGGESLRFDENAIEQAIKGTKRVMHYLNMVSKSPNKEFTPTLVEKSSWVRAKYAGMFRSNIMPGDTVKKNQIIGSITDPYGDFEHKKKAPFNGIVIGKNNNPIVHAGDALFHLGKLD
jgi:predicted deacylase